MDLYYVSSEAQKTGSHEVHKLGCDYFPVNYIYLGSFSDPQDALAKARRYYPEADGCPDCCAPRHSSVFFNPS